jgi:glucans biosynthesis protein C
VLDFPFVITAAPDGVFETGHLWFLVCLLGFSLALLPGLAWLRRPAGRRLLERLGGLLAGPGGLLLPSLPLAVVGAADAGAEPLTDMDSFSMAFRLLKSVDGWLWVVAIVGLARSQLQRRRSSPAQLPPQPAARRGVLRRLGAYANEAVLPFYVLHETVIVAVAYLVLLWPVGPGVQYGVIALVSLAATLLLYDLGVRRNPVTRFLFGLKA